MTCEHLCRVFVVKLVTCLSVNVGLAFCYLKLFFSKTFNLFVEVLGVVKLIHPLLLHLFRDEEVHMEDVQSVCKGKEEVSGVESR